MNPTPLTYLDGETLMSTVLLPIRFVVDKLLPQGLHILAGSVALPVRRQRRAGLEFPYFSG